MKRNLCFLVLLSILGFTSSLFAQINTTTTISWPFDLGTEGQTASYTEGTADYFKPDHVTVGSNLSYKATSTVDNVYTLFQPAAQSGVDASNVVSFNMWPVTGLTFTPTKITFDCMRFGTDGGNVDVTWVASNGTSTTISSSIKPARNNTNVGTHTSVDVSGLGISASDGECTLEICIYNLGNTKQVGLADIIVEGTIAGTIQQVNTYKVNTSVSPAEAGEISSYPVGTEFDEKHPRVTLTAAKNFGYTFSHWENASGSTVSEENPYTFTLTEEATLTAVYDALNTYELSLNIDGGGKDYMVTISPEGTMVDDLRMYEEGTTVTLTAASNPVLTFTNWNTGATSTDLVVNMNDDTEVDCCL